MPTPGGLLDQHRLGGADEGAGGQGIDARALDRRLEREVEVGQGLAAGQAREAQRGAHAAAFAGLVFGIEQRVEDRVRRLALLDRLAEHGFELVGGVGQAQSEQAFAGAVEVELAPAHRATSARAA
nr:hypothetical protein [Arenimonas daejeonensis]